MEQEIRNRIERTDIKLFSMQRVFLTICLIWRFFYVIIYFYMMPYVVIMLSWWVAFYGGGKTSDGTKKEADLL